MTNINFKEMEGNLLTVKLTTSPTMSMIPSQMKDTEENSLTDEPNGTITINGTTNNGDEIEMEEPLTPESINLFTITNTTLTPITITLPKSSFVYKNDDETLPDLQPIEKETTPEEEDYPYVEISDEEPTFMDDKVIVQDADIEFLHEQPAQVFKFSPLNSSLREECGPLMNILECGIIEFTNVGVDLIGKPRNVHHVKGDGNSYCKYI